MHTFTELQLVRLKSELNVCTRAMLTSRVYLNVATPPQSMHVEVYT